jgi:Protein of unknown function (DUF2997)
MPRIIEVTISPRGDATVQTKGYAGPDCLLASKFLEQSLGVATNEQMTTDFYQTVAEQQQAQQ